MKRYNFAIHSIRAGNMAVGSIVEDKDGEYIKYDDVIKELKEIYELLNDFSGMKKELGYKPSILNVTKVSTDILKQFGFKS